MKQILSIILLSIILVLPLNANSIYKGDSKTAFLESKREYLVKGKLVAKPAKSSSEDVVAFVDIAVSRVETPNKVLYTALSDESGEFVVKLSKPGKYLVSFSSLGIYKITKEIILSESTMNMGEIEVKPNVEQLKAAEVTEQKKIITSEVDKLVYSVVDDPDAKTNNALDILRKVPRVTVDGDDKIQVNGNSGFTIYVNGKPSSMFANNPGKLLKNLPASGIKKMEVISEPGAKYDAEGVGGILNIVMNTGTIDGYNISLNAMGGSTYSGAGLYGMMKAGKFSMSANYSYGAYYNQRYLSDNNSENLNPYNIRNHFSDTLHFTNTSSDGGANGNHHMGTIEASYEIDTLNLITLSGNLFYGNNKSNNMMNTSVLPNSLVLPNFISPVYSYKQSANSFSDYGSASVNLDYQHISKNNPNELLTLSYKYDYSPNNSSSLNELSEKNDPFNKLDYMRDFTKFDNKASLSEHTFQTDYSNMFKKMHSVEAGVKYIFRDNHSTGAYLFKENSSDQWANDLTKENANYNSDMHIAAAYASYGFSYKQIGIKLGVRDEFSAQIVDFALFPERNFNATYNDIVPSAMFSWRPTMMQNLNLSYNMRIRRPGISHLNPFVQEQSPNSISYGNPNLDSEKSHFISLSYGLFSQKFNLNASLGYMFSNNQIMSYLFTNDKGIMVRTYDNIGKSQNASASLYLNYNPAKMTRIYINASGNYSIINGSNMATTGDGSSENKYTSSLKNSGFSGNVYAGFQQSFKYDFRLSANAGYYAPNVSLQGRSSGGYYYSLGLSKSFLDDDLNLSLNATNFANEYMTYKNSVKTDYLVSNSVSKYKSWNIMFSISYRFGDLKASVKKTRKSISNDDVFSGGSSSGAGASGGGGKR